MARPRVTVEDGVFTYEADAVVLQGAERDRLFARAVEAEPGWAEYQAKTDRTIPVVALHPIKQGPPNVAAPSPGAALKVIHDGIRHELALIRKDIGAAGPGLGAQLRVNCLTLCKGLHNHHTGEAAGMFPYLAERHPEHAPVIARLAVEHEQLAVLLDELQTVIEEGDPLRLRGEVERLTERLEAHLRHEEEQLIPLLDGAAEPGNR